MSSYSMGKEMSPHGVISVMKKLLSLLLAAASVLTMSTAVLADDTSSNDAAEKPTFSFDTKDSLSYLHKFGNAEDTNLSIDVTESGSIEGRALKFSEDFKGSISNQYGGVYIDASDLGLDTFAGFTFEVNIKATKAASKAASQIVIFGDGQQWISSNVDITTPDKWVKGSVSVPANVSDTKFGISIPITQEFSGDVILVDNVKIYDNYGKQIANVGDIDTTLAKKPNLFLRILGIIGFIVLILGVLGGGAFFIMKVLRRYR